MTDLIDGGDVRVNWKETTTASSQVNRRFNCDSRQGTFEVGKSLLQKDRYRVQLTHTFSFFTRCPKYFSKDLPEFLVAKPL